MIVQYSNTSPAAFFDTRWMRSAGSTARPPSSAASRPLSATASYVSAASPGWTPVDSLIVA